MDVVGQWNDAIASLLDSSYLAQPSALADVVNDAVRPLGAEVVVYLADREQVALRALPESGKPAPDPVMIDASMAGRAFRQVALTVAPHDPTRVWLPILDGTERLGVLAVSLSDPMSGRDAAVQAALTRFGVLIGHLLVAKLPYGDTLRRVRRSQPMSVGGELLWRMLPPLTFATSSMALSAVMEPCYDVGGDAFDYAVDDDRAIVGIFDAVGHDLNAALTSTLALAATRRARTAGAGLAEIARAGDDALAAQFADLRYVTAVLAELDLIDGHLSLVNAGHPPPLLLRTGRSVATLDGGRRLPLGFADQCVAPVDVALEPGDQLLFYTDGIIEARGDDDEFFGLPRLVEFAERQARQGFAPPEIVRRLSHAVLERQRGQLQDDATLLLMQWGPGAGDRTRP